MPWGSGQWRPCLPAFEVTFQSSDNRIHRTGLEAFHPALPDIAFDITGRNGERRLPGVVQQLDDIAAIQFHGRQRLRVNGIEENKDDALVGKQFTLCGYVGRDVRVFEASVKYRSIRFLLRGSQSSKTGSSPLEMTSGSVAMPSPRVPVDSLFNLTLIKINSKPPQKLFSCSGVQRAVYASLGLP